ncbi:MAG: hypothetical protein ABJO02_07190 [Reichenbachiella sp.]|uniref:hypothetical protein n=1 Tax=Reichenbachiella sp. TaxID=2184521 RepID=UPI00329A62B0
MKQFYLFATLICFSLWNPLFSQERVRSAKVYTLGDSFSAPTYGLNVSIPESWSGFYPQDSEIFKMTNDSIQSIECMYFASENSLDKIEAGWNRGFALAQGLSMKLEGEMVRTEDMIVSRVGLTNRADVKGVVLAKCGDFGVCVSALVYGPTKQMKTYFTNLIPLLHSVEFVKPIPREELEYFDWQKELTGKYVMAYERDVASKKQSQIWLYLDGTFKSKISRTGLFKGSAGNYKGTKKGTYLIFNEDQGEPAKLVLSFSKLPEVELPLTKKDKQFYINDQVFYYSEM